MLRALTTAVASAALLLAAACGGSDDAPKPSGNAMAPAPGAADAASSVSSGDAPVIERVALNPAVLVPGVEIQAVVGVSDPDGDSVRVDYTWTRNGREVQSGDKPVLFLVDLEKGDRVEVTVTATDGMNRSLPMSAVGRVGNRAPTLSAVTLSPFGDVRAGTTIKATPQASDPDNDTLRYSYEWKVNGKKRGTDREFETKGLKRGDQIQVHVVATDGAEKSRPKASPVLMLGNSPPVITQLPTARTSNGVFQYTFKARDPDGDRHLRFFVEKGPSGMRIDGITGVMTWAPTAQQAGLHKIEVGVKDQAGEGSTFSFELNVNASVPEPAPAAPTRGR